VRVFVGCGSLFDDVLSKPISEFFEDVLGKFGFACKGESME
jgi:hypothetical protein